MQITIETEITRHTWQAWRRNKQKPRLTWLELHKLAEHLTGKCRENFKDYQEIDFAALIDPQLNYYENLDALELHLHTLGISNLRLEAVGYGTERLRHKLDLLRASYRHLLKRLVKEKRRTKRLKAKLNKPKKPRRRKPRR